MSEAFVIHFVRGFAPGHAPICGTDGMGSILPQLVTCPACKALLEGKMREEPMETSHRNIATQELLKYFAYAHLPEHLQAISAPCCALAIRMCEELSDSRELTVGLRKLLEAKDCFVRARLPPAAGEGEG